MKSKQMVAYMTANGIPFGKAFPRAEGDGCISEYREIFAAAYAQLEKYICYGLNNGFTPALKEAITNVTKVIVAIGDEETTKNKSKITKQLSDIDAEVKGQMAKDNAQGECNVVKPVVEYIESYLTSIEVLLKDEDTPRKNVLEAAREKLLKLKAIVEGENDVCTTEALAFAQKIVGSLRTWGEKVVNGVHSDKENGVLDEAINTATKWSEKTTGVVKHKRFFSEKTNLASDVSSLSHAKDVMSMRGEAAALVETVTMFQENVGILKDNIKDRFNTDSDREELDKWKEKRRKLEQELDQLDADYDNGVIDNETYVMDGDDIESEILECDEEIKALRKKIEIAKKSKTPYMRAFRRIEQIFKVVMGFKDDPQALLYIVKNIEFTRIRNVLNGHASAEDIQHAAELQFTLDGLDSIARKKLQSILDAFDEQEQEQEREEQRTRVRDGVQQDPIRDRAEESQRLAEERRRRRERMKNGGANPEPVQQPVEQPTQQELPQRPVGNYNDVIDDN